MNPRIRGFVETLGVGEPAIDESDGAWRLKLWG